MPPFTRQLSDARDPSRPVSPGGSGTSAIQAVATAAGQLGRAFTNSQEQRRADENTALNQKLAIRADARNQITSDQSVLNQQEADQLEAVTDRYMSIVTSMQVRLEQDQNTTSYNLNLRNLIDKTVQENPGFSTEIMAFVGAEGHDTLAFQEVAMAEAQAESEIATAIAVRDSLTTGALAMGLDFENTTQDQRDVIVGEQRASETQLANHLSSMDVASRTLTADSAEAAGIHSRQVTQYTRLERENMQNTFNGLITASLPLFASVREGNATEVGAGRDAALRIENQRALYRNALLERNAGAGLTAEEGNALVAEFDNYTETLDGLDDQFGERLEQSLADLEGIYNMGSAANSLALRWLNENFGSQMMGSPEFSGINSIPRSILDRAMSEGASVAGPNADASRELARMRPYLNNGTVALTSVPAELAVNHVQSGRDEMTRGAALLLNNSGDGALDPGTVRIAVDGVLAVHSGVSAMGGATDPALVRQVSEDIADPQVLAMIIALNNDTAYTQDADNATSAYRLSATQLMATLKDSFDRPTAGRRALFGTSQQVDFYHTEVDDQGFAHPVLNDPTTDETSMVVQRHRRLALQGADTYNSLNEALLATDQFSDVAAFRDADEASRRGFHAHQAGQLIDAETQEPLSPFAESRAVRREEENLHMSRLAALEGLARAPSSSESGGTPKSSGPDKDGRPELLTPAPPNRTFDSFLDQLAHVESSGNPEAQASGTSAAGLFQFTSGTWADATRGMSAAIRDPDARFDPEISRQVVERTTASNFEMLREELGRDPSDGELYSAHFLGRAGSRRLMDRAEENPNQLAAEVFPRPAQQNPNIFTEGLTVEGLIEVLEEKMRG